MGKESAFDPKHLQTTNPGLQDFLEESNLPPQVIFFLQKNGRALLVGAVCLILAFLGWVAYGHYTGERQGEASALLAQAIAAPPGKQQAELFHKIIAEYGDTDAAIWSRVQLAHAARKAGNEKKAIADYRAVLADIDASNPLVPLLHYSLGQAYEAAGQPKEALRQYQALAVTPGFKAEGLLAEGRIQEAQHRPADAIMAYEQLAALKGQPIREKDFVADKLAALRAQVAATDKGPHQPPGKPSPGQK